MNNRTILIISHVNPFPPAAGNEIRISKMINWLRTQGYKVLLLLNSRYIGGQRREQLEQAVDGLYLPGDILSGREAVGCKIRNITNRFLNCFAGNSSDEIKLGFSPATLRVSTGKLCRKYRPVAVIAEYIFASPCLESVPEGILRFIDTHDMFSRKREQVICYGIDDPLECTREEERSLLLSGDVIIAIQDYEGGLLKQLVPERKIITVGVDFEVAKEIDNSLVTEGRILFVGSGNPLNKHGLKEFIAHCWPVVIQAHPKASLRIIGKVGEGYSRPNENIFCNEWVESIDDEYRRAEVVINPVIAGSGLKIKTVEALCYAKPLVATVNAVEGLGYEDRPPFLSCSDWGGFAEAIELLLTDREKRLVLQQQALVYAREHFNSEHVYRQLTHVLNTFPAQ